MTSTFILTAMMLLLGAASLLQAQPKLEVRSEIDWGEVVPSGPATEQQRVTTKLSLKNTGNSTLRVFEVRPSCGCITTKTDQDSIAASAEMLVDVGMNLPVGNGPLRKTLTIRTNEPTDSIHVVVLKAELVRPIQFSSGFIPFNSSGVGSVATGELTVTSFAAADVVVTVAELGDSVQVLSANPFRLVKGKPETVRLAYKPTVSGSYKVDLQLRTSLPGYEAIPVSGFGVALER